METKTDYRDLLEKVFFQARMKGICKRQGDFAGKLGIDPSTLSNALRGNEKYLTDNLIMRVRLFAKDNNLEEEEVPSTQPAAPDIVIPAATAALYNNMSETIRIQAEIIARLQGTATERPSVQSGAPQKSTRIEL